MSLWELFVIAVGLSMDAFAVSICKGLSVRRLKPKHVLIAGLYFGGFQALMPLAGWFLGSRFAGYIQNFDHWVAFVLLVIIGGNMLREAFGPEDDEDEAACAVDAKLDLKQLFLMAVATSIDALAVGVTFAFLEVKIVPAISIIGTTTFCLSLVGVAVGNFFGTRYKKRAEAAGGIILILLGIKILLEHLGIL